MCGKNGLMGGGKEGRLGGMKMMDAIRGAVLTLRLRMHGHKVGGGLSSRTWNPFECSPGGRRRIEIGKGVKFGRNMSIRVKRGAELVIGDRTAFTGDTYVRAERSIRFGAHVLVAEHVSVRDSSHGTAAGTDIADQHPSYGSVEIGRDVWIGAGCRILMGAKVPDGCIIGANSVVIRKSALEPGGVYGGAPVRLLKKRG